MKRYYISDYVLKDNGDGIIEYVPACYEPGMNMVKVDSPRDPVTGAFTLPWCLVLLSGNKHSKVVGRVGVDDLPDFPPDGSVKGISVSARNKMKNALSKRDIDVSLVDTVEGYRALLDTIGKHLHPNFDINSFDINDPV